MFSHHFFIALWLSSHLCSSNFVYFSVEVLAYCLLLLSLFSLSRSLSFPCGISQALQLSACFQLFNLVLSTWPVLCVSRVSVSPSYGILLLKDELGLWTVCSQTIAFSWIFIRQNVSGSSSQCQKFRYSPNWYDPGSSIAFYISFDILTLPLREYRTNIFCRRVSNIPLLIARRTTIFCAMYTFSNTSQIYLKNQQTIPGERQCRLLVGSHEPFV